ncbi:hypothetical protein H2203_002775 [Taxawa tesnikishii (nom. ined.)]|nr:hypothetical protein H2203_002775 [Dothideales sp. JES 119]
MNWVILHCPFTPFMVIFCHVVTSLDRKDLRCLEDFVASMPELKTLPEPVVAFRRLCHAFYSLAKEFVESKLQEGVIGIIPTSVPATHAQGLEIPGFTHSLGNMPGAAQGQPDFNQDWPALEEFLNSNDLGLDLLNGNISAFGAF